MTNAAFTTTASSILLLWLGVGAGLIMSCDDQPPPPKKRRVTFKQDERVTLGQRIKGTRIIPDECMDGFTLKRFIASGAYGSVYEACKPKDNCNYVVKFQRNDKTFFKEFELMYKLAKLNVGPKPFGAFECGRIGTGILVTEKWDGTMEEGDIGNIPTHLLTKLRKQIQSMHDHYIIHCDIHHRNVLVKRDEAGKLTDITLTDFGLAKYLDEMVPDMENDTPDEISKKLTWTRKLLGHHQSIPYNNEYFEFVDLAFEEIVDNPQHFDKAFLHYLTTNNNKTVSKKANSKKFKSLKLSNFMNERFKSSTVSSSIRAKKPKGNKTI